MENTALTVEELKIQDPEKYFRDNLEVEEFEGLETLVRDSNGVISWEKLIGDGVVKIEGRKVEGIYWKGDLDMRRTKIKSLWKIKNVKGYLDCFWVKSLENLGELEETGLFLDLRGTKIKTLGKLKKVGESLDCGNLKTLEDLGNLEEVGGSLYLIGTKIKSLGKLKKVGGDLDLRGTKIKSLGKLKKVGGYLDLIGTSIKSLGKLKKVGGDLDCENLKILEDLGELEEVGGNLYLRGTKIKSLGKVKKVGGDLDCEDIKMLEDIGDLEEIGGNMNIKGISIETKKKIFRKIRKGKLKVKGEIILYGDMNQIYEGGKLNYSRFREKYGDNISEIKDEETKELARYILIIEYEIIEENLKEKGKKIQKENEGKKLTEEEKKNIRKKVMKLGKKLGEIIEKIESFGLKLENL